MSLSLSWGYNSTNETGFGIQRTTSTNGTWTQIATVAAPGMSYMDTNLDYATTYYYRIFAYNATQTSPYSGIASFTTPAAASPALFIAQSPASALVITATNVDVNHAAVLEMSTNLAATNWMPVLTNTTIPLNGIVNWTNSMTNAAAFFRVRLQSP
ncbi:MAG TPA: fibronectin type III domain-containing protein [Verrucomicrobiae bacterium]|nr:fibronectin type III domain-containing protein [Verrucomicrobiae bacterium]